MTTQKTFKRRVRERMAKTGERYAAARQQLDQRRAPRSSGEQQPAPPLAAAAQPAPSPAVTEQPAPPDLASAVELASDEKLHDATGRHWLEWISILDSWGATTHTHTEIAEYLRSEQGVPSWWTQAVTTGYERARGMRAKHQQADGFTVYASKTMGVPIEVLFEAFADDALRQSWLADGSMSLRNAQPGKVARFDWAGDRSRVEVTFEAKGQDRATAHVAHSRLAGAGLGEAAKVAWRTRLAALKAFLAGNAKA
jgi:hypothetical protein